MMSGGTFWDMLASHTKVAGKPVHDEDRTTTQYNIEPKASVKSTWSNKEEKLFETAVFLTNCARKLEVTTMVKCTSCWLLHKFYDCVNIDDYDEYIVSMTCLFLAGKIEETPIKIRDVVNVAYRTAYPNKALLQIDETYTKLVETLVNFELFMCRMLRFQLTHDNPHKYLLHYLKSLTDWMTSGDDHTELCSLAWSLLNDCYFSKLCISVKPDHLAVTVCYIAMQTKGVCVDLEEHAQTSWWKIFVEDVQLTDMVTIAADIMDLYKNEKVLNDVSHL